MRKSQRLKKFLTISLLSILSIVSCHKVVNLNNQYICTQIIENINRDRQIKEFQEFSSEFPLFSLHFINKESEILYRDSFERSLQRVNESFNFHVFGIDKVSAYNIFIIFKKDSSVKALGGVRECGTNDFVYRNNTNCWELIIFNEPNGLIMDDLVFHELLHCLYIKHSYFQDSIMFPWISKNQVLMKEDLDQGKNYLSYQNQSVFKLRKIKMRIDSNSIGLSFELYAETQDRDWLEKKVT